MIKVWLTVAAMVAFAANSVLARMALDQFNMSAGSFTLVRLGSAMVMFAMILTLRGFWRRRRSTNMTATGSWASAACLFIYALSFSYAYLLLGAAMGALVLFGVVQLSMIAWASYQGQAPKGWQWLGLISAFAGLTILVWPELGTPNMQGLGLMAISGFAWAGYSVLGKGSVDPLNDTAFNFIRTLPACLLLALVIWQDFMADPPSLPALGLAVASGALASGLGYSLWYAALRLLSTLEASVVQLSVPIITAIGGLVFIAEPIGLLMVLASALVLGGIGLVVTQK